MIRTFDYTWSEIHTMRIYAHNKEEADFIFDEEPRPPATDTYETTTGDLEVVEVTKDDKMEGA